MAIGGALRAAMKAGNWASAARESRRRARALAQLNASGGIGGYGRARTPEEFLRRRGVDVDAMVAPGTGNPYMDFVQDGNPNLYEDFSSFADSPFGGVVYEQPFGSRYRLSGVASDYNLPGNALRGRIPSGNPIEAPYEGFRVLPGRVSAWGGDTPLPPGPWMGRGQGTSWGQAPVNGFDASDGSYWFNASRYNLNGTQMDSSVPRAFGGFGGGNQLDPFPAVAPQAPFIRGTVPFEDIMNARGYIGNRYSMPAPPSPGPGYYWDDVTQSWEILF